MPTVGSELFSVYAFWGSILALKLFSVLLLIARARFSKKVFISPEDVGFVKGAKVSYTDPDVERARRAHQNDLENILVWYAVTYFYLTTNPPLWLASLLIKTYVFARIVHTVSYIAAQQPTRAIAFFIGVGVTLFQICSTILYYA